ncbi:hypothetical protein KSP39_PZI002175 [Platanthera zijinensis]|uniref:Uncharacterized protein n=1 Tax=Platanthera zijinensis TaxID=2320716 RepID=A0AAP0BXW7_9ASPA
MCCCLRSKRSSGLSLVTWRPGGLAVSHGDLSLSLAVAERLAPLSNRAACAVYGLASCHTDGSWQIDFGQFSCALSAHSQGPLRAKWAVWLCPRCSFPRPSSCHDIGQEETPQIEQQQVMQQDSQARTIGPKGTVPSLPSVTDRKIIFKGKYLNDQHRSLSKIRRMLNHLLPPAKGHDLSNLELIPGVASSHPASSLAGHRHHHLR